MNRINEKAVAKSDKDKDEAPDVVSYMAEQGRVVQVKISNK